MRIYKTIVRNLSNHREHAKLVKVFLKKCIHHFILSHLIVSSSPLVRNWIKNHFSELHFLHSVKSYRELSAYKATSCMTLLFIVKDMPLFCIAHPYFP